MCEPSFPAGNFLNVCWCMVTGLATVAFVALGLVTEFAKPTAPTYISAAESPDGFVGQAQIPVLNLISDY